MLFFLQILRNLTEKENQSKGFFLLQQKEYM
jgi:hypothetical protein